MRDLSVCRNEFPSLQREIFGFPVAYLDGPGGTQVPQRVIDAMTRYYETSNANTHGQFAASRETDEVVLQARQAMAALLGADGPQQISFGQNMTTLNFALARAVSRMIQPGDEIVVTDLDHDANVAPWLTLAEHGAVIRYAPVTAEATLDMSALHALLNERTKLVAVGYASNAVGTVNDVSRIREWTREVGALLVVDAVHFAPHGVVDVASLDPDFLLCSAYKFFGPHVGILYSRAGALDGLITDRVRPQSNRASEKIETGTLNHAALAGVTAAVEFIADLADEDGGESGDDRVDEGADYLTVLRDRLVKAMQAVYDYEHTLAKQLYEGLMTLPGVQVYGPPVADSLRAPTVSFTVQGSSTAVVAKHLGDAGLYVWDGNFYAVTVLERLGLGESGGLIRIGFAPYNTTNEVERVLEQIRSLHKAHM